MRLFVCPLREIAHKVEVLCTHAIEIEPQGSTLTLARWHEASRNH